MSTRTARSRAAVWLTSGLFGLALCARASAAHAADKLLVYQLATSAAPGSNAAASKAQDIFKNRLGLDSTLIESEGAVLPADLSVYSQIYIVSLGALEPSDIPKLVAYTKAGGSLYLTGERPDPFNDPENLIVQDELLKAILNQPGDIKVGTGVEGGGDGFDHLTLGGDKGDFSTQPNMLEEMIVGDPGIVANVPAANVFAKDADGNAIGALWTRPEVKGRGCVMLMMDINWWHADLNSANTLEQETAVAENVFTYLKYCNDPDGVPGGGEGGATATDGAAFSEAGTPGEAGAPSELAAGGATASEPTDNGGVAPVNEAVGGAQTSEAGAHTRSGAESGDDAGCGCRLIGGKSDGAGRSLDALFAAALAIGAGRRRRGQRARPAS